MFIKWKRYTHRLKNWRHPDDYSLSAVLVECQRVDGKPRHKVIAHLATVSESGIHNPMKSVGFWNCLRFKMTELGFTDEQQAQIEQLAERRVPRPPDNAIVARSVVPKMAPIVHVLGTTK